METLPIIHEVNTLEQMAWIPLPWKCTTLLVRVWIVFSISMFFWSLEYTIFCSLFYPKSQLQGYINSMFTGSIPIKYQHDIQSYLKKIFESEQSGQDHLLYLKKTKLMQRWQIKICSKFKARCKQTQHCWPTTPNICSSWKSDQFQTLRNNSQQHTTTCNGMRNK